MVISQKIQDKIDAADAKLNKIAGFCSNNIASYFTCLIQTGSVEVGYRAQCGSTHITQKTFSEFVKIISILKKEGFEIYEERQKHKNGYATNNGGFWNSIVYKTVI